MATDLQKEKKAVKFPRKDTTKPVTEPNSLQVEFVIVKDLKVDEKWMHLIGVKEINNIVMSKY